MFGSLRARLWLSYLFVIGVSVIVVLVGLIWALQRSPLFYRQTALNIQLSGAIITGELQDVSDFRQNSLIRTLVRYSEKHQVAVAILDNRIEVVAQNGFSSMPAKPKLSHQMLNKENYGKILTFRDSENKIWFYSFFSLDDQHSLLVASPRPRIGFLILLRQEFGSPIFIIVISALLLALVVSILMANWIGFPLQHIASAARELAEGKYHQIPLEGPEDIRQVAETFNEMTARIKLNQQSQQDFIANVSHELKTPLTSIQGFAQAIIDETVQSEKELMNAAGIIYEESGRMHRLVNDLLSLSRLETGLTDFMFTDVNLSLILETVLESFKPQLKNKQIETIHNINELPVISGDGDRLAQVFTNLIDNAIKFSPESGTIILQAEEKKGFVEIRITDSGPGIPVEEQKRIFERFYQVDKSRKGGPGRGVGLGLAIASQIVLAHNGTIRVEDSQPRGTVFVLTLPV